MSHGARAFQSVQRAGQQDVRDEAVELRANDGKFEASGVKMRKTGFPSFTLIRIQGHMGYLSFRPHSTAWIPLSSGTSSIIAHIDHGKSTLADRLLEATGALQQREMMEQVLDTMDLERERGITIKAHAVRLNYRADDGQMYQLNLIDTPGHVDFTYEVSRSLQACEGALLVVDASQGVEAQTLANTYLALNHNLEIIPVINKIDLPSAEPERIREQIEQLIGLPAAGRDPGERETRRRDQRGVGGGGAPGAGAEGIARCAAASLDFRLVVRSLSRRHHLGSRGGRNTCEWGRRSSCGPPGRFCEVEGLGYQSPKPVPCDELSAGEAGFLFANIKTVSDAQIGDTVTSVENPAAEALPGFQEIKPMVFAGLYPVESHEHGTLARGA